MDAQNMFKRHFKKAVKDAKMSDESKLPDIRFHDLRHTYASLMLDMGMDFKYLQVQMGHSDIKTTLNTYAHLIEKNRQDRLAAIEAKIKVGKNGSRNMVTVSKND
jgi:integrase